MTEYLALERNWQICVEAGASSSVCHPEAITAFTKALATALEGFTGEWDKLGDETLL